MSDSKRRVGFTLIEVFVVVTIIIILGLVTFFNLQGGKNSDDVTGTAQQISALLREAQVSATSQKQDTAWGVYFSNATNTRPFYALISSSTYSSATLIAKYPLPASVAFVTSTLPQGSSFVTSFAPISGAASTSTTVSIYSTGNPAIITSILVNQTGQVSYTNTATNQDGFFGLDVNNTSVEWPSIAGVPFGSVRLWDSGTRWNQIETSPGNYTWTTLDNLLTNASANNQTVLYTFGGDPTFYSSAPTDTNCSELTTGDGPCDPPADVGTNGSGTDAYFQSFVTALMQHLQQKGEAIQYFEMWNEVNNYHAFWNGTAAQLVRMAADARTIIKSYEPTAIVLTPNTCNCSNTNFTDGVSTKTNPQDGMNYYLTTSVTLPSGKIVTGASVADGVAFHPYLGTSTPEGIVNLITKMQTVMSNDGVGNLPLIDTESSWGLNTAITGCSANPPFTQTCLDNMAAFLARSYILAYSNGLTKFYWYQWGNNSWGTMYNVSTPGLYEPAQAYAAIETWLAGSSFKSPCTSASNVYTCSLTSSAGTGEEIVWNTSSSSSFAASPYTHCSSIDGSACTISGGSATIGAKPILLTP